MRPVLRIINDVWDTASHALKIKLVGTTTVPVSAAALPLPAGAALESGGNLDAQTAVLQQQMVLMRQQVGLQKQIVAAGNGFVPVETLELG